MPEEGQPTPTNPERPKRNPGKPPLNVRPKDDQLDFVNKLIAEKGSQQTALVEIIYIAMGKAIPFPQPAPAPAPAPAPPTPAPVATGYVPTGESLTALLKIMKKRALDQNRAIDYSIKYTQKNEW